MLTTTLALALMAGGLKYEAPKEWAVVQPSSAMRLAEWTLAPASGDTEEARVIVFYFGKGGGGGVEANLERWNGQFQQESSEPSKSKAAVKTQTVGTLKITRAEFAGTYVAELRPGGGERHNKPNFRMIAAIAEGGDGPWFIRLVGPKATVARWEKSFDAFLQTLAVN